MYTAASDRYERIDYRRCPGSGLRLPALCLGLWQNFGDNVDYDTQRQIVVTAFDRGITHFDLANNYGPPPGSAESSFGRMLAGDLAPYRDELVISTKAGYDMWPGPYGEGGSRKYLLASLDASLRRLGLDYVDIFYSHRFDPYTPLVETLQALKTAIDSGRALYAGISSYSAERTMQALHIAAEIDLPILIHQPSYSLLNRWVEQGEPSLLQVADDAELAVIAFSPLAQGMLSDKYLNGIPAGSRAAMDGSFKQAFLTPQNIGRLRQLNDIASERGQTLAQMALSWVLRDPRVTCALIGASSVAQLQENLAALDRMDFSPDELAQIDRYALDADINIWAPRSSLL